LSNSALIHSSHNIHYAGLHLEGEALVFLLLHELDGAAPHIGLGGEHVGDLVEDWKGEDQTQGVGLAHPAFLEMIPKGESSDHCPQGVRVTHLGHIDRILLS